MNKSFDNIWLLMRAWVILLPILVGAWMISPAMALTEDFKVAIVLPGVITDKSFNQAGYEGVQRAADELDIEFAYSEKTAQPDQPEALADYARRGYDIVIGHGGEFQESVERVARRFPDTQFIIVNGVKAGGNVAVMSFDFPALGYVTGYLAGKVSESGKGGYIGAQKLKFYVELGEGFASGSLHLWQAAGLSRLGRDQRACGRAGRALRYGHTIPRGRALWPAGYPRGFNFVLLRSWRRL